MPIYFNDLTLDERPEQNRLLMVEFWQLRARLADASGVTGIRVVADRKTTDALGLAMSEGCDREQLVRFGTFFTNPYESEELVRAEDYFKGVEYSIGDSDDDYVECRMLGWAAHERTLAVGFYSSPRWGRACYRIRQLSLESGETEIEAICVTKKVHLEEVKVRSRIASLRDFEHVDIPAPCAKAPSEKHIKVQMHDGKDVVLAFAEKLCRHELVQGVIDTIAFDSTTSRFVIKYYEDGVVDLRMHWTPKGFGLKVQTTARGLEQTRLVAEILEEAFDRRS